MKKILLFFAALAVAFSAMAVEVQYSFTIDQDDFNTTSYAANNSSHNSTAVCTTDATKTMTVAWTSNQIMQSSSTMQWQKSNGYLYNTTDLGTIASVTVNSTAGSFTTYYGTVAHPTSGTTVGNGYFTVKVGSATGKTSSIVVVFKVNEADPATTAAAPTLPSNCDFLETPFDVTITNNESGATVYYTTDGTAPSTTTTTSFTGTSTTIQISATTTVKAMAVASGKDNSSVASGTYTYYEPYTTIASFISAKPAQERMLNLTDAKILGVSGYNMYVADASGSIILRAGSAWDATTYVYGKSFSASVRGTYTAYATQPQVTVSSISTPSFAEGTSVPAGVEKTISDLSAADQLTQVTVKGLTFKATQVANSGSATSDYSKSVEAEDAEGNIIVIYNTFGALTGKTLKTDRTFDITGLFINYSTSSSTIKEVCPQTYEQIVYATQATATISFAQASYQVTVNNGLSVAATTNSDATINYSVTPSTGSYSNGVFTATVAGEYTLKASVAENDNYTAAETSCKIVVGDLLDPGFAFEKETYKFYNDAESMAVKAVTEYPSHGTITYSCTEENIVIDATTGAITCTTNGIYSVVASITASGDYKAATCTCSVVVKDHPVARAMVAEYNGKYYAASNTNPKEYFTATEVCVDDNKVLGMAADNDYTWYTEEVGSNATVMTKDGEYLMLTSTTKSYTSEEEVVLYYSNGVYYYSENSGSRAFAFNYNSGNPRMSSYVPGVNYPAAKAMEFGGDAFVVTGETTVLSTESTTEVLPANLLKTAGDTRKLIIEKVTLEQGTFSFALAKNGTIQSAVVCTLEIPYRAQFKVTFTYDEETNVLSVEKEYIDWATSIENSEATQIEKIVRDGKVIIIKNGVEYSVMGQKL